MLQKISTDKAPAAIGPYSQGIIANNMLFASGQIPINPATGEIEGTDIAAQAELVMKNIGELLKAAGTDYTQVVKTTCFLADMGDFAAFNEVYAKYFTEKPARSCVAVKTLPKNVLCEEVVKTTCFLADMGDFAAFNEVYAKYFTEKPARSCVAVKTLPKNVLCEVEVIAVVS